MIRSQSRLPDVETHFYDQNPLSILFSLIFQQKLEFFCVSLKKIEIENSFAKKLAPVVVGLATSLNYRPGKERKEMQREKNSTKG